ncbi:MAG: hypothetical protein JXR91_10675 [Deltaproteobacteria bacterium]|nr:hypothetical protein [Deltaproteobacteria bacterium]
MVKKTTKKEKKDYKIIEKRSGRFAVKNAKGKYLNGEAKVEILLKEKKIKLTAPKKKEEAAPAAE